jgi:hypothetical protein
MKQQARQSIKIVLSAIVLFFSCVAYGQTQPATTEQVTELRQAEEIQQSSPSDTQRFELGRIGVVVAGFRPEIDLGYRPMTKGVAVLHFAGQGALGAFEAAARSGGGYGGYAGAAILMLAPVAAIVGAIVGGNKGESAEKIKEAEDVLNRYLSMLDIQGALRDSLLSMSTEQVRYSFAPLDLKGPNTQGEEIAYDVSLYPDIDTVLEIGIRTLSLVNSKVDINPDLTLGVDGSVRFLSAKDGTVLYARTIGYSGATHKFMDWAEDNARPFSEEMDRAVQFLAERIVEEASYLEKPPSAEPSEKRELNEETAAAGAMAQEMKTRINGKGIIINFRSQSEQNLQLAPARPPLYITINNLSDKRSDKLRIGERTAAFGVTMGNIFSNRKVTEYLSDALSDALRVAGHKIDSSENDVTIDGEILKFWIETPATVLYWDVTALITINLNFRALSGKVPRVSRTYTARKTERTYLWPSAGLIEKAVDASVTDIMSQIRSDEVWVRIQTKIR